jgi:hypothetical protein
MFGGYEPLTTENTEFTEKNVWKLYALGVLRGKICRLAHKIIHFRKTHNDKSYLIMCYNSRNLRQK